MNNEGFEKILKASASEGKNKKPSQQDIDLAQQFAKLLSQK